MQKSNNRYAHDNTVGANKNRAERVQKVNTISRGGLLLIPRVTDMRNGMFRPEVAWRKGRMSDIVFGEVYDNQLRAQLLAELAAGAAVMSATGLDCMWQEIGRAVHGCHGLVDALTTQVC